MKSLRARLLVLTATLLAVGILAIDVATVVSLRSYLTSQVDQQLIAAREPLVRRVGPIDAMRPSQPPPGGVREDEGPGRGIGLNDFYIEIRRLDGTVETQMPSALRAENEPAPMISNETVEANVGRGPFTVPAGDLDYRVLVVNASDGSGTVTIAAPLDRISNTIDRVIAVEAIATTLVLAILLGLGWVVIRRDLRPLEDIAETSNKIAQGDLSLRVAKADDASEVGRLGLAFNKMLGEIETSFAERARSEERLRRFAADASHELRTPLTSVRGYAELYRQGAIADDEHLARVMSRIESEATRMGLVVEDLMLLARLDQGRPLGREPVDVGALVANAVADARVIDSGRSITFSGPDAVAMVSGDRARLHQVVTNLLSNAIKHTPTGTPVAVMVMRDGQSASIRVADSGQGLAPADAERIFERFFRVDEGRSRDVGGSGLGLSIVDALVRSHGGTVSVDSELGRGTVFEVRLPLCDQGPRQSEQQEI